MVRSDVGSASLHTTGAINEDSESSNKKKEARDQVETECSPWIQVLGGGTFYIKQLVVSCVVVQ